jgi:uncharacterized protein (DUF488 family)
MGMEGNLVGIGYEGLDIDSLLATLRLRSVSTVVDVRLNAISRKRGMSKNSLRDSLASAGIQYEHHRALGNPRDNRDGFAETETPVGKSARARFSQLLTTPEADSSLARIHALRQEGVVALLCFEADESHCHREILLRALRDRAPSFA